MNTLLQIRYNSFYQKGEKKSKEEEDKFIKHFELVFLVDKPKYSKTNSDEIVQERAVEELRMMVAEDKIDRMIEYLQAIKKSED